MKKLLLIPTVLFPYTVCACLAYCFISGSFSGDPITEALGTACLVCPVLALVLNIIYIVLSRKAPPPSTRITVGTGVPDGCTF